MYLCVFVCVCVYLGLCSVYAVICVSGWVCIFWLVYALSCVWVGALYVLLCV